MVIFRRLLRGFPAYSSIITNHYVFKGQVDKELLFGYKFDAKFQDVPESVR